MIEQVLPEIKNALQKEDRILRKRFANLDESCEKFYADEIKSIASYNLTERTLQYIIFKELCPNFKILPEDSAYAKSNERLDLSIYKNIVDRELYAEIGIELKRVNLTKKGLFTSKSLDKIIEDFDKIKKVGNKNKYLLMTTTFDQKNLNMDELEEQIIEVFDNRKFKKYRLCHIDYQYFKTKFDNDKTDFVIMLWKLIE